MSEPTLPQLHATRARRLAAAAAFAAVPRGPDMIREGCTCEAPTPQQQRHCRGYVCDVDAFNLTAGRCAHRVGSRCYEGRGDA